jgi:hypothetical protein
VDPLALSFIHSEDGGGDRECPINRRNRTRNRCRSKSKSGCPPASGSGAADSWRFYLKIFILALSTLVLAGCSDRFGKADLIGKYILNVGIGLDVIELNDDGTYTHSFQGKDAPNETRTAKWKLEDTEDGQTVTLDNFQPLPGEQTNGSGFYLLKPQRFLGTMRLMRNTDLNEYYKKE